MSQPLRGLVCACLVTMLSAANATADDATYKLRIATVAPDGTSWANMFHKFEREVAKDTDGKVEIRMYFGGISGTEPETYELMRNGKLDGALSGGPMCSRVIPSMKVLDIIGLFQNQGEATYVLRELRPTLDKEAHAAGFALLGAASIGSAIMFSREPITSMAELRKAHLWVWELKVDELKQTDLLKMPVVPTSLADARKAFDNNKLDGFLTTPVTMLAFQWYVGTKYITDLHTAYVMGCFLMRENALDRLPPAYQNVVRAAAARVAVRIDAENDRMDRKLLGGTLDKLGLKLAPVSKQFRAEFFEACRLMRQKLSDSLVPRELLEKVTQLLADYRAEHQ